MSSLFSDNKTCFMQDLEWREWLSSCVNQCHDVVMKDKEKWKKRRKNGHACSSLADACSFFTSAPAILDPLSSVPVSFDSKYILRHADVNFRLCRDCCADAASV